MSSSAQQTKLKVLKPTTKSQAAQTVDLFLLDCEVRHLSPRTLIGIVRTWNPEVDGLVKTEKRACLW